MNVQTETASPPQQMRPGAWASLIVSVVIAIAAAWIGSQFTATGPGTWYASLVKPTWNPPNWLFGVVWTLLYLAMAVAAWLVWRKGGWTANAGALTLYGLQLALNVMWSAIFFTLQRPGAALIEIVLLWIAVLLTTLSFWKRDIRAGALFLPYLAWVTFAVALNFSIWRLNP